jgi:hypothetical protein
MVSHSYNLVQYLHSFIGGIAERALAGCLIRINPTLGLVIPKGSPREVRRTARKQDSRRRTGNDRRARSRGREHGSPVEAGRVTCDVGPNSGAHVNREHLAPGCEAACCPIVIRQAVDIGKPGVADQRAFARGGIYRKQLIAGSGKAAQV